MVYINSYPKDDFTFKRSFLFMPASNRRALEKAKNLPCDGVIFDLEDSIFKDERASAHANLLDLVKGEDFGGRQTMIRTSALDTASFDADLIVAINCAPNAILLPKISTAAQLVQVEKQLNSKTKIWAMIENPLALMNLKEICSATDQLAGLIVGPNDLAKETGAKMNRTIIHPWLMMVIAAARAYNLAVLDGVYNNFRDLNGFKTECRQSAEMGFDGKTLIHPSQIEITNQAYRPQQDEITKARKIIEAFTSSQNIDKGAIQIDGEMIERLHLDSAIKLIKLVDGKQSI